MIRLMLFGIVDGRAIIIFLSIHTRITFGVDLRTYLIYWQLQRDNVGLLFQQNCWVDLRHAICRFDLSITCQESGNVTVYFVDADLICCHSRRMFALHAKKSSKQVD